MPLEWSALWAEMKKQFCGEIGDRGWAIDMWGENNWTPTTEDMYYDQLGAVPPVRMGGGVFLVGEAANHTSKGEAVYAAFASKGGQYFARYMTTKMYDEGGLLDTLPKAA